MQIRLASDTDETRWNDYISRHPHVSPYHHYAWKKSIENAYGHECFYLFAEDSNNRIAGILPTASITPPLGKGKLYALPFCDTASCLADDKPTQEALISKATSIARQQRIPSFEHRTCANDYDSESNGKAQPADRKVRMLLDLPESSDILLGSFKAKLRSQIKKAVKNGLTADLGRSDQHLDDFYDVFTCNMKDLGSPTHSKRWFQEIRDNYMEDMIISVVRHEGTAVGAGIVLFKGPVASIPWASTKRKYNRLAPNMLLYWSLLEYTTDHNYKIFDFGRSTYGEGTYNFKKQWGAKPLSLKWETYDTLDDHLIQNISSASGDNRLRRLLESTWRKLPLALTVAVGSRIRKYISL